MEQIFGPLAEIINSILFYFYELTGNYGLAIILLTLVVNIITFPLTKKQISASRRMQELQPELKKLQEKYKGDKEKLNKATMEYMRENKVNPLGGCLPLLIQLPIIIGVFQLLSNPETALLYDTSFIGLDLKLSPAQAGELYALINPYYILPIISAAATFLHQRMVLTDPKMKIMLYVFPVMILVISVNFPAGLVLYWTTNSLLSVGNHFIIKGLEKEKEEKKEEKKKDQKEEKTVAQKDDKLIEESQKAVQEKSLKKKKGEQQKNNIKNVPKNKKKAGKGKKKGAGKSK